MRVINNKREFDEFYYYSQYGHKPSMYPVKYPCVCKIETEGEGGIGGGYEVHYVAYFPKTTSAKSAFLVGLNYKWHRIS